MTPLRLSAAWQGVRHRFAAKGVVLMYHRIASEAIDPWGLCVPVERFAEHLAILQQYFRPTSLQELLVDARRGRIRHGSVGISFDDGYVDNVATALPMLLAAGLPATFFVTAAAVDSTEPFWWDQLAWAVFSPGRLPEVLEIRLAGQRRRWVLGAAAAPLPVGEFAAQPWNASPGSRGGFHYSVWQFLRALSAADRRTALVHVCEWSGSEPLDGGGMSSGDLRQAAAKAGVEIGAHSVSHPNLLSLDSQARTGEIAGAKRALERLIGRQVTAFAYPYGEYDEPTTRAVREAGFALACAADPGSVSRFTDPYAIPRVAVGAWDGDELRRRLSEQLQ